MESTPRIGAPGVEDDFHDSSLIDIQVDPGLASIAVVLSTPNRRGEQELWMLTFRGVLRVEFEITGNGSPPATPLEVYSVYRAEGSDEERRWLNRLRALGESPEAANGVRHIVLASSFVRGWGDRETLEGIQIICREVRVDRAPRDYLGYEYDRPRIEGS